MSAVSPAGLPQAATSAAVPPLEPPGLRWRPQGLELRPYLRGRRLCHGLNITKNGLNITKKMG